MNGRWCSCSRQSRVRRIGPEPFAGLVAVQAEPGRSSLLNREDAPANSPTSSVMGEIYYTDEDCFNY